MRDAAKRYIEMGLRPVPVFGVRADGSCTCGRPKIGPPEHGKAGAGIGKHPIGADTWKDRLHLPEDFPDGCNLALQMGKQRNGKWLVAVDVDGDVQIEDWLGPLPATLTAITGRGYHMIFQTAPFAPLGNWRDVWGTRDETLGYKPGFHGALDLRFARGAIVAPPSRHANGNTYQWLREGADIAEFPLTAQARILAKRRARGLTVESHWFRKGKMP